jgi:hypothetical protein
MRHLRLPEKTTFLRFREVRNLNSSYPTYDDGRILK